MQIIRKNNENNENHKKIIEKAMQIIRKIMKKQWKS